ncbi:PHP domain-containing protein [Halopenitus persicus]|uniref:PHP domain-containing protein n=1 Tax=Halopenitus persicus TaxID=1048396 RepID=UPI001E3C63F5|nr:PHP domain-containing protein [Halopenitus persicus]
MASPTGSGDDGTGDDADRCNRPPERNDPRVVADLHVHTTASDGSLTPATIPAVADEAGLEWVAVTDHDRIHPDLPAPVVERGGIRIVRGIELRVEASTGRYDLLGYAVERTDALVAETDRLQADRMDRGRRIIDRVEDRTGVELDLEPHPGLGRPHIARAIADSPAPYDYDDAFAELIGGGCPCYVPREITPIDRGIDLLREACAVVGLAHPFRYGDPDAALAVARDLDAVERWYPYGFEVDGERIDSFAADAGLLRTGGSDAHDRVLGTTGLTAAAFEPIRRALPDPE